MQKALELTRNLALADLKDVAQTEAPCITVYIPLQPAPNTSRFDLVRLNSAVRQAEQKVRDEWSDKPNTWVRELIEPMNNLTSEANQWGGEGGSLVILRSPDVFRAFEVKQHFDDQLYVGDYFHVFPLIRPLQLEVQRFYILALSQKHVRLLRCTPDSSEPVPFPDDTYTDLEGWLNTRMPNASPSRTGEHTSEIGCTEGSFNSVHDRDYKDEHLWNFFKHVDKSLFDMLHDEGAPLILCGVDYIRSMYGSLTAYKHVVGGVQGSPDSMKGLEMHARALEVVQLHFAEPAKKALELWEKVAGAGRTVTSFPDIVKAAFEARIAHMFAVEGAQTMGVFDRETMQMKVQGRQTDLVNAAALQTIAFGGDVFLLDPKDMPGGDWQVAAITRF
jgi:hypothetical protein